MPRKHALERLDQLRELDGDDLPDDVVVDELVPMHDLVPRSDGVLSRNPGVASLTFRGNTPRRLTDNGDDSREGKL